MGLRALEVEVLDSSGKHLATHPRAYGQASTNSEDPSMQLALLCNKPASWPNSRVRDALPDPLREWLDRQDRQTRNEALQTLKRVDRESGWANAVEAMLSILESTGGADRAGVTLLAARLLFQVVADSYEKRSVVFTTNLEFGRWGEVFGDGDMAAAVIDRIVHHGRIVRFRGESYRNSHSLMK